MTLFTHCAVRRNTLNAKAVTLYIELNDLRCANISLISYTSWSIYRKSTWWTVCWRTSPSFRSVATICLAMLLYQPVNQFLYFKPLYKIRFHTDHLQIGESMCWFVWTPVISRSRWHIQTVFLIAENYNCQCCNFVSHTEDMWNRTCSWLLFAQLVEIP